MRRLKKLKIVKKSGQSQAKEQTTVGSNEVNQSHVGDSGGNQMVSNFNHQNGQPQSEASHVESHTTLDSTSESLGEGEKRTRGYSHMLDVWGMLDGEFILVEVDAVGNPIGLEAKTLLNAIGSLVRRHQCAPINYLSWKDMPESYITNMLDLIQSKFQFVPKLTEQTKKILKDEMSIKWRQFKYYLKSRGYDVSMTEEEMASNIPDTRVDPTQYRVLVHHWCSKEGQEISNINKRNRSKYEDLHCMGTKNLPRLIHETTLAKGVQPTRAQIYIDTRTRSNGSIVTEKAADVINEFKMHMADAESSDSTNWKDDLYSKVKGPERRGRVRCLGTLPRRASSNSSSQSSSAEGRLKKLENLFGNLVSVLQTRFGEDQQINEILQAVAQEVPDVGSASCDSMGSRGNC